LRAAQRLHGHGIGVDLHPLGGVGERLGKRADFIEQARFGALRAAPLLDHGGPCKPQVLQRMGAHVVVDEGLVVGELLGRQQRARERMHTIGVIVGERAHRRLVRAEELPARTARGDEPLQLQRQRPGVEQAHERCELAFGPAGGHDHTHFPAQGVVDHRRIGLGREDAVGMTSVRLDEVCRELTAEDARAHVALRQRPLRALDGNQRATRESARQQHRGQPRACGAGR